MELSSAYSMRSICETLGINRSTVYYQRQMDEYELELRDKIEQIAAKYPRYGYRRTSEMLKRDGYKVGYRRVARIMKAENLQVGVFCINPRKGALRGLNNQSVNRRGMNGDIYVGLFCPLFMRLLLHLNQKLTHTSLRKYIF